MNSDNFLIEEIDIQEAQKCCQTIENPITRQRAVANTLAANLVLKYFDSDYVVDTKTGVHNIPQVLNKLENPQNSFKAIHIAGTTAKARFQVWLQMFLLWRGLKLRFLFRFHI